MTAAVALLRFRLRRDRVVGTVWVLVLALSALFVVGALAGTYGTEQLRVELTRTLASNPSLLAVRGAPDGASAGAFFMTEIGASLMLLVAFMNTFTAVRHTRADEEQGRSDLLVSTRAGRVAGLVTTVLHALVLDVTMGGLTALAMIASGYPVRGSVVLGWALTTTGLAFFAVGLVSAQVFSTSRSANGWASAAVGAFWVLNAAADANGTLSADGLRVTPAAAVWLTPVGWGLRTRPYTADAWASGLISVAFAAVLVAVALWLLSVRDTSAGLVAPRRGRARASAWLGGPAGLAWRLQRGSVVGWGVAAVAGALLVAALGKTLNDAVEATPDLQRALRAMGSGSGTVLEVFVGLMAGLIGLLVAGAAIQTVIRLRQEEAATHAETLLATPVTRVRWYLSFVLLGLVASAVILVLAGLLMGGALAGVERGLVAPAIALSLAQLPAVGLYLAITAVTFGVAPRATAPVGWAVFGFGVLLGEFGALLGLPSWVRTLAPTNHTATVPLANADWTGTWVMSLLAAALIAVGGWAFSRRAIVPAG